MPLSTRLSNCVYPFNFAKGIAYEVRISDMMKERIAGLQGNASMKRVEDLDSLSYTDAGEPSAFASSMVRPHERFGIKIMGGCCGTDSRHIEEIAKRIERL
jgi:homocysteine S-methyltransferase